MAVSVSVVLLLIVLAGMQMRNRSLKPSHAVTCVLLGFCLASSSLAPTIQSTLTSTASLVSTIHPERTGPVRRTHRRPGPRRSATRVSAVPAAGPEAPQRPVSPATAPNSRTR